MNNLTVHLARAAPEFAVLEVLSLTLKTTITVLVAADPGLFCESPPPWVPVPQSTRIAEGIVELASQLLDALANYQNAVNLDLDLERQRQCELRSAEDDEVPF